VAAAEKEGEVAIYGQPRGGVGKAILAFKDAYSKIKINFVDAGLPIYLTPEP
jgi:hypothetical protein